MSSQVKIDKKNGWFSKSGRQNDVVIASRVRLARNLNGHKFPGKMDRADEDKVTARFWMHLKVLKMPKITESRR